MLVSLARSPGVNAQEVRKITKSDRSWFFVLAADLRSGTNAAPCVPSKSAD